MSTSASGPTLAGGTQPIVKDGYELLYLPDVHNDALQREGKAPVFYYLPNYVHIARKNGDESAPFMFNLIRFQGVQTAETNVGVQGTREVVGGVCTFTVTSAPPDHVLQQSQQQIIDQYRASSDYFWGIRTNVPPVFRPVPIVANATAVSNVSPLPDGTVPAAAPGGPPGASKTIRALSSVRTRQLPRTVPANRDVAADSNLDPWFWRMQGQGNGCIDPMGQNAYSALLGAYPSAILWQAFHGTSSPIVVTQSLKIKMWAPLMEIKIHGSWRRIFDHFSAAAQAHYLWASADVKAEFNNMRVSGDIEVEVLVDPTIPGAQTIQDTVDKKTDLVFEKFMSEAQKIIFDPPQPQVPPAEASSSGWPWGVGLALKWRHDQTDLELNYHEKREQAYLQENTISSSLEGMFEEMKKDPDAEKKYFLTVYMDDAARKLGRIVKPVVNWPKPEQNWAGEPVAFVSAQIGYPTTQGDIAWTGHMFQKSDPPEATWSIAMSQKQSSDVANPPAGWSSDKTYIKRTIHLLEPPSVAENPFVRVQIDGNTIDLDPEPNGSCLNDCTIEARADSAGALAVGPVSLNVELEDSKQTIEVTMEPTDAQGNAINREPVRFSWSFSDQAQPRFWSIFTGDKSFRTYYHYKVRVVVKGSIFTKGMEWEGPWVNATGNGPIMISVPTPDDAGVVKRELPSFLTAHAAPVSVPAHPPAVPAAAPAGAPPARRDYKPESRELEVSGWSVQPPGAKPAAPVYSAPPPAGGKPASGKPGAPPASRSAPATPTPPQAPAKSRELEVMGWRTDS